MCYPAGTGGVVEFVVPFPGTVGWGATVAGGVEVFVPPTPDATVVGLPATVVVVVLGFAVVGGGATVDGGTHFVPQVTTTVVVVVVTGTTTVGGTYTTTVTVVGVVVVVVVTADGGTDWQGAEALPDVPAWALPDVTD